MTFYGSGETRPFYHTSTKHHYTQEEFTLERAGTFLTLYSASSNETKAVFATIF
jgi:hypothetical protein